MQRKYFPGMPALSREGIRLIVFETEANFVNTPTTFTESKKRRRAAAEIIKIGETRVSALRSSREKMAKSVKTVIVSLNSSFH